MARKKTTAKRQDDAGWLFVSATAVPKRWRDRSIPCVLVPLLPEEAHQVLSGSSAVPGIDPEDEDLARLVGRGLPAEEIAAEMGLTRRTVDRHLARLRKALGTRTTTELAAALATRGFR